MDIESHDLFDKNTAKPAKEQFDDTDSDSVDWDIVHEEYHRLIIGPWSSVMTRPDPNKNNKIRNHLLKRLLTIGHLDDLAANY